MLKSCLFACALLLALHGPTASGRSLLEAEGGASPSASSPVPVTLPDPGSLSAMKLSLELVGNFTEMYGAGTLYALCRNTSDPAVKATRACEKGYQCCGYLGSADGSKLPDTCVRNSAGTECPRMYPGRQGAPCATGRQCGEDLVCCDARPFLEGLTTVPIPTCQHPGSVKDEAGFVFC